MKSKGRTIGSPHLSQLEREAARILQGIRRLELVDVPSAAKLLHTTPKWVRAHLPIVVLGPRGSRVRRIDIEAYQQRRTIWPRGFKEGQCEKVKQE